MINRLEVSDPAFTPNNVQCLTIHSSHTNRRHDVTLYNVNTQQQNAPIIFLLHGVYGNSWVWMHLGGVDKAYEDIRAELGGVDFILAMPSDGGLFDGSAYLPLSKYGDYERWIMQDVLEGVISTVPSASLYSNLYISGLSMGGYGALRLGFKYATSLKAISAHSAITDINQMPLFVDTPLIEYHCENPHEASLLFWAERNKASLPPLRFDCGTDDELIEGNKNLHHLLSKLDVDHQFEQFSGGHSWQYWHTHVARTFKFFAEIERKAYF